MNLQELLSQLQKDKVEYVRFEGCNVSGMSFSKTVPVRHFEKFAKNGMTVFCGLWNATVDCDITMDTIGQGFPNAICMVDPQSYTLVPWSKSAIVGRIMMTPTLDNKPYPVDPRQVCLQQIQQLQKAGYSIYSAMEYEFQLFDSNTLKPLWEGRDILNTVRNNLYDSFVYDCERKLLQAHVDLQTLNVEYGPGQCEWTMSPAFGIRSMDNAFIFRNGVKEMAQQQGWIASFATKPIPDSPTGNGCHFNHSLWKVKDIDNTLDDNKVEDHNNVFYSNKSNTGISDLCKHWIAGILHHIPALIVFANSTENCFRRTNAHSWAPGNATWGRDNRTTLIRVKTGNPGLTYLEYRLPGSACCPYLVMASVIAAGLDGIEKKMAIPKETIGYAFDEKNKALLTPKSLEEALNSLQKNDIIKKALGNEFIEHYINTKQLELKDLKKLAESKLNNQLDAEKEMFFKNL